ncbi:FAD-binding oxidoreductase [Litchfieldella rifensis]|uniref:FAD-dependent oxidoreductase n=1 Tax=Litchfieldella rifensis TaxID=762643 RepID=A0ABV7LKR0_9GAMM
MKAPLSWNRFPRVQPDKVHHLGHCKTALPEVDWPLLAYGNGRSYGDVCLTESGTLLLTRRLDRFMAFDPNSGVLRCESGVTLAEILSLVVPQGWFLPSTPGTRYATVGGALANDVHGKNHHVAGTFGHHVRRFELVRSSGERLECTPDQHEDYFRATIGGLGLTGLISWVEFQLLPIQSPWMWVASQRFGNLDEFWSLNRQAESQWPYTVAWIDCLASGKARGRGIFLAAQHAPPQATLPAFQERSRRIALDPPVSLINNLSLRVFNALYYRQRVKPQGTLQHYVPYFYPLDAIQDWNRIYGRRGFFQYQCVLPPHQAQEGIAELLNTIAASGQGSFLAVLKTFGEKPSLGMLSFPRPGTTLALDFSNRGEKTLRLLASLDSILRDTGGALYPAKDARMPADLFQSGFPEWERFADYVDPAFSSRFWRRVTS